MQTTLTSSSQMVKVRLKYGGVGLQHNITKMRWYTVWEIKFPRTYIDTYKSSANTVRMSVMVWMDWGDYWVIPARGNEMLKVTLQ